MYEVYNNSLCIYANDLIRLDSKRNVGSEKGFLAEVHITTRLIVACWY